MINRDKKRQFVEGKTKTRVCEICGKIFVKNNKYSIKQWNRARACSRKCSGVIHSKEFKPTIESKERNRLAHLGKISVSGERHPNWKGGITPLRKKLYFSNQYKEWRMAVFSRDDFTCQFCGKKGGEINADHIKPWSLFPSLRFDLNNGRTLCLDCHRKTDTWGIRKIKSYWLNQNI